MSFYADLHVHSKYSRATSRHADLEHLALWGQRKGLGVIATGDFTHPAWWQELREKLVPAEPGLFRLREDLEKEVERLLPASCRRPPRFLLEVEISTIYKAGERTRKIHHLVYAASFETAGRFRDRLGQIGNIASDGRPILGLDSRHLLEIVLESGDDAYLVPAHIWTPWFAALGSKSGFDSIADCYGDLAEHIFAVETGLSSDPPMNWRVSALDRYTLVSSSDAHSPPMLGREASVFESEMDYFAIRQALETGEGFGGTVEFFPEEGKYHLDGHRACGVRLAPEETRRQQGRCPVCGKPLTVGVLHRVEALADRDDGARPETAAPYRSLVQLPEILGELHGVGAKSKRVERSVAGLVGRLGPEMAILEDLPLEEIGAVAEPLVVEAVRRLRAGEVRAEAGYDGEFGTIRLFEPDEITPQLSLFGGLEAPAARPAARPAAGSAVRTEPSGEAASSPAEASRSDPDGATSTGDDLLDRLDPEQRAAAEIVRGALLVVAGPGTGKTRTLTHRIAHLVRSGEDPETCLAITFTRRAAGEMRERLDELLPNGAPGPRVTTFHGLGLELLRQHHAELGLDRAFQVAADALRLELLGQCFGLSRAEARERVTRLSAERRGATEMVSGTVFGTDSGADSGAVSAELSAYREMLWERDLVDFDDLVALPVELLARRPDLCQAARDRFRHVSIDEYQDIDALQYRLVRLLAPDAADPRGSLCAIGDPDQSIYRFRGADVGFFLRFGEDFPGARTVQLERNYRSAPTIVEAARQAIAPTTLVADRRPISMVKPTPGGDRVIVDESASGGAEAERIAHRIEALVGGTSYFSIDSGRLSSGDAAEGAVFSFDDIAVLYRTKAQAGALAEALERAGIPYQRRNHEPLAERREVRRLRQGLETAAEEGASAGGKGDVATRLVAAWKSLRQHEDDPDRHRGLDQALELLKPLARRHDDDLRAFLRGIALETEVDAWDPRAERVALLTLHAAKGLEFPVVFLAGCEDGLLPLSWGEEEDAETLAEERRLFFVGLTRARSRLVLSWARRRGRVGETAGDRGPTEDHRRPSPFLDAIADELLERHRPRPSKSRPATGGRQLRLI